MDNASTPTGEPFDTPLTIQQQAGIRIRHAGLQACALGVPLELALAEIRWAYANAADRA